MPRQARLLTSRLASASGIAWLSGETHQRALTWAMPTIEMASSLACERGRAVSVAITSAMASAISSLTCHSRCCTAASPVRSDSKTNRNSPRAEETKS